MQFAVVRPARRTIEAVQANDPKELWLSLGHADKADFGKLAVGYAIIVDEFGLLRDPAKQHYFSVKNNLYANDAVIYGFDRRGETVPVPTEFFEALFGIIKFHNSPAEVEQLILKGQISRPHLVDSEQVTHWKWAPDQGDMVKHVQDLVEEFLRREAARLMRRLNEDKKA